MYAQLNIERIIEANPQVVYLITHGNPEDVKKGFMEEMKKNPAWNNIDAVKNNHIEILPPHLFSTNPGTNIIDAIEYMANSLKATENK